MTVIYKGLDCLADKDDPEYTRLKTISQSGVNAWAYQKNYGYYVLYFGAVLIFLMIIKKTWFTFNDYSYRNTKIGGGKYNLSSLNKFVGITRLISYKKLPIILSRITGLPASIGTLIILISSTLFVLCYCFIPHFWYRACRGFGSPPLSVRAGLMCMGMTPFIFILSGKTNFISAMTGISYEKLNIYHQALGWGCLFLSLVHTIPFLIQPVREGGASNLSKTFKSDNLYQNGIPAQIVLGLLCLLSTRFSRKLCYEVWLHAHWILGIAYFALLTWHVYGELDAEQYMWGTLGFWGFQMIYRALVKTSFFKPNQYVFKAKKGELSRLSNGNFQIVIKVETPYELNWKPGQHLFIRFVYGLSTLDNHPFSILSIPKQDSKSHIKLIVKPHNGLTKKIYNLIEEDDEKAGKQLNLYIDGPYGGMNRDVLSFDKVLMVSSGSGVTVTWPFVEYIVENLDKLTNMTQQFEFKWIVKNNESIEWIQDELINVLNQIIEFDYGLLKNFKFEIFITNSQEIQPKIVHNKQEVLENTDTSSSTDDLKSIEEKISISNLHHFITIHKGQKPSMSSYLQQVELLSKNCVIVSGTQSLQCDVGNAVSQLQRKVIKGEIDELYLHSENFGW